MNNKQYRISVNGTLVDVTEEVYLAYYRSERRMRYFERDIKTRQAIRDKDGKITGYAPSKEDSLDRLLAKGDDFGDDGNIVEDSVITKLTYEGLYKALDKLAPEERELVDALFFSNGGEGMTVREYAKLSGIPFTTIQSRKVKILEKLKKLLRD
jgi:DNA-directed RNA polymerase specialized sigma24 family protein